MGHGSKIGWTDSTWNPWHGCTKVSAGCKHCYMFRDKMRYGQDPTKVIRSKQSFDAPLHWKEPQLIFTCSWSDWFHQDADPWRDQAWQIIKRTPQHTYQILTKRPERIADHLPKDWGTGYPNVWLGISAEDQTTYAIRLPLLLQIPADVRYLSLEPLLGPIELSLNGTAPQAWGYGYRPIGNLLHWVIVGGESGVKNQFRPCELSWIEQIVKQCQEYQLPVFVKQMGTHLARELNLLSTHGTVISSFPEHLRLHEYPALFNE